MANPSPGSTRSERAGTWRRRLGVPLVLVPLCILALLALMPLAFGFISSLKSVPEILSPSSPLLPTEWRWDNYSIALSRGNFAQYFVNSVLVTSGVVVADTVTASMCGYVLARQQLWGKRIIETLFIGTLFIGITTAVLYPQYQIARALGLANLGGIVAIELVGVTLVHIYLVKAFVGSIDPEIEQAARLDGCGVFRAWRHIAFPLMRPILATTVILAFQASWNNYQVPLVFSLTEPRYRTIIVGVSALQYDAVEGLSAFNFLLAGANIALVPIIVVFLLLQRHFVKGWTEGAIKG